MAIEKTLDKMTEKWYAIPGDFKQIKEDEIFKLVEESITVQLKKVEVGAVIKYFKPKDAGFENWTVTECCMVSLKGDNLEQYEEIKLGEQHATLYAVPDKAVVDSEIKIPLIWLKGIPDVCDIMKGLMFRLGTEFLVDTDNHYWVKGKWFQTEAAKSITKEKYDKSCEQVEIESDADEKVFKDGTEKVFKDGAAILTTLCNEGSFSRFKTSTQPKHILTFNSDYFASCIVIALCHERLLPKNKSWYISNFQIKFNPESITALTSFATLSDSDTKALESLYLKLEQSVTNLYTPVSLPDNAPKQYQSLLLNVIQSKFHPLLTIKLKNETCIYVVVQAKVAENIRNFIKEYTECNVPRGIDGVDGLANVALPYPRKYITHKCKLADSGVMTDHPAVKDVGIQSLPVQLHFQKAPPKPTTKPVSKDEKPTLAVGVEYVPAKCIAIFAIPNLHMAYFTSGHMDRIKDIGTKHKIEIKYESEGYLILEAENQSIAKKVLNSLDSLYKELAILTKEVSVCNKVALNIEKKMLIISDTEDNEPSITGQKKDVEQFEALLQSTLNTGTSAVRSPTMMYQDNQHGSQVSHRQDLQYEAPADITSPVAISSEKRKSKRIRQLADPSRRLSQNLDYEYTPAPGLAVFKHEQPNVYLEVGHGDITKLDVDVIVNAANEQLKHAGGVAYYISKAAGPLFDKECENKVASRPLAVGDTCVTSAGDLPNKAVVHAVGPKWDKFRHWENEKCLGVLQTLFEKCLVEASKERFTSIAIPALSSGVFGVPVEKVAKCAANGILEYLSRNLDTTLQRIRLIDIKADTVALFEKELHALVQGGRLKYIPYDGSNV